MIKIKYSLFAIICITLLCGCGSSDGYNKTKLRNYITTEMKTTEIMAVPNYEYTFIVRTKDGAVWFVECMSKDAKITAKAMIFPPIQ